MFCKEQVAQLRDYVPRIREAGGELVIVGNGNPQQATWFQEDTGIETPLYTDPSLKVYDAVEAKRGLVSSLNPGTISASFRARGGGFQQTKTMGTAFQQGGVFVITSEGEMPYRYVSKYAGDHPDPEEPVSALERVAPVA